VLLYIAKITGMLQLFPCVTYVTLPLEISIILYN